MKEMERLELETIGAFAGRRWVQQARSLILIFLDYFRFPLHVFF
jgi:hypothetical protein